MTEQWSPGAHFFPAERLNDFLVWAWDRGASDVSFQTSDPVVIEVDGRGRDATGCALDDVVMGQIVARIRGGTAEGLLRSGKVIDCSYAVRVERGRDIRFRCNMVSVEVPQGFGINVTMRILSGVPPSFEELGTEEEIVGAFGDCAGLNLVTGVPGSGKSTLLAAGMRRFLETGVGRIQSYEAPIEFLFGNVNRAPGAQMSSSEIPTHVESFAEGLRATLRRKPAAVVVGELRDRETVEAALIAANFGVAVYGTTHTIGVANTIRRLLEEFREDERDERGAALIDMLHLVVTQMLLPNPEGGRTAIREWLVFDGVLKGALLEMPRQAWSRRISDALLERGNGLGRMAEAAAAEGRIETRDLARIRVLHGIAGDRDA